MAKDVLEKKFKAFSKTLGMSEATTLKKLVTDQTDFGEFDTYLQYLGISDANKRELYEGDVIELTITPDMLDIHKNGIANSNMGKYIIEEGNITSVICEIIADANTLCTRYNLYCLRNGEILRYKDGKLKAECTMQEDSLFPQYLSCKGATWIGNMVESPNLLQVRGQIWNLPEKAEQIYIEIDSKEEMFELVEAFGKENIVFEYPNILNCAKINDFTSTMHQAYAEGFRSFLYEKSNPEKLKPVDWRHKDGDIRGIKFLNFRYSNIWNNLHVK